MRGKNCKNTIIYVHEQRASEVSTCKVLKGILEQQTLHTVPPTTAEYLSVSLRNLAKAKPSATLEEEATAVEDGTDVSDGMETDTSTSEHPSKRNRRA